MHNVYIDKTKNRLIMRASGFVSPDEAKQSYEEFEVLLQQVKKNSIKFTILLDLRGFKASSADVQPYILKVQEAYVRSGAERVASVVDSVVTTMQFQRLGRQNNIDSYLMRFNDVDIATKWLDGEDLGFIEDVN